ncbi:MAG: ATP-binding cassette domain-containing protein [Actinomycetota bacterium]
MADSELDQVSASARRLSQRGPDLSDAMHYADPQRDAMSIIGSEIDMPLRPSNAGVERSTDVVTADITASGWLTWPVNLTGAWRDRVAIPLLVRRRDKPSAVLTRRRGALVVDGAERHAQHLDRARAAEIGDDAIAVAPDLPPTNHWLDLVRWGLRGQRKDAWLFVLLALVGALTGLALPVTTSLVFQWAIPSGNLPLAIILLLVFATISLGAAILALSYGRLVVRMRDRHDLVLSQSVMARLLRLRVPFFRTNSIGDISNRAMSVSIARAQVGDFVIVGVVISAIGLSSLLYLFTAGLWMGLLMAATVAALLLLASRAQVRSRRMMPILLDRRSRTDATTLSLLQSLVAWRVTASEGRAFGLWADRQRGSTQALRRRLSITTAGAIIERSSPTVMLAVFTALVVYLPTEALEAGSATAPGVFIALYAAVLQLTIALLSLGATIFALSEYGPILDRLRPILTAPIEGALHGQHPGPLRGQINLHRVTFGYAEDRAPLFDNLSLDIAPGEFVAVVGPSGSGKSTLLRLILGFEQPWTGFVSFDGRDLAGLDAAAVRRQMGVVLQASQPLGRTLRQCVTVGKDLSDERVWGLLEQAGLADDVRAMPLGLATPVGESGTTLSGGQRQRLMIASAMAVDPVIMLFDEATSALDNVSQTVVMRAILESHATRVVIAHRLSTVQRADRVVVVSNGQIEEQGPPDELLRAGGLFARLAARQLS